MGGQQVNKMNISSSSNVMQSKKDIEPKNVKKAKIVKKSMTSQEYKKDSRESIVNRSIKLNSIRENEPSVSPRPKNTIPGVISPRQKNNNFVKKMSSSENNIDEPKKTPRGTIVTPRQIISTPRDSRQTPRQNTSRQNTPRQTLDMNANNIVIIQSLST